MHYAHNVASAPSPLSLHLVVGLASAAMSTGGCSSDESPENGSDAGEMLLRARPRPGAVMRRVTTLVESDASTYDSSAGDASIRDSSTSDAASEAGDIDGGSDAASIPTWSAQIDQSAAVQGQMFASMTPVRLLHQGAVGASSGHYVFDTQYAEGDPPSVQVNIETGDSMLTEGQSFPCANGAPSSSEDYTYVHIISALADYDTFNFADTACTVNVLSVSVSQVTIDFGGTIFQGDDTKKTTFAGVLTATLLH